MVHQYIIILWDIEGKSYPSTVYMPTAPEGYDLAEELYYLDHDTPLAEERSLTWHGQ